MDGARFDQLSRLVGQPASRRAALGLAAALGLGPLLPASGRRRRNRCRGGCGACRLCQRRHHTKRCVPAPEGTACAGGTCRAGTCCVPETCASLGQTCGPATDGCGGQLACGTCGLGATSTCHAGTCAACAASCPAGCDICFNRPDGSTVCADNGSSSCAPCTVDADCPAAYPVCITSYTNRAGNDAHSFPASCSLAVPGVCTSLIPC